MRPIDFADPGHNPATPLALRDAVALVVAIEGFLQLGNQTPSS